MVVFRHSHIGRVTAIRNNRIYTNEGNTSALYGDRNGGTVKNKDYAIQDSNIKGYCLIDYGNTGSTDNGSSDLGNEEKGNMEGQTGIKAVRVESFQRWLNTYYPELLKKKVRWTSGRRWYLRFKDKKCISCCLERCSKPSVWMQPDAREFHL